MTLPLEEQQQARAAKRLIREAGGLEASAEQTGKSSTQLDRYGSPNDPASMTIAVIEELEAVTHQRAGHPIVTRYLAAKAGYTLVKLPEVAPEPGKILQLVADQAKESTDITERTLRAVADGKLCDHDAQTVRKEIRENIEVLVAMDAHLALVEEGGG